MAELPIPAGYGVPLVDLATGLLPEDTQRVLDERYAQPATPATPHLRRFRGTDQPIPSNAVTEIAFDSTDEERGAGLVASGAGIQAEAAGLYLADAVLRLDGPNWGERTGYIRINGTEVHRFGQPNSGDGSHVSTAKTLLLAAGDIVTVATYVIGDGVIARSWLPATACSLSLTRLGA